jgi:hypothetical protein
VASRSSRLWPVGGGVEHHEPVLAARDDVGERAEYGDLLGAWRAEVLFEQRAALGVEVGAGRREHLLGVGACLFGGIDP